MEYKCPKCGETKNLHYNYDWSKQERPILDVLCNECGEFFGEEKKETINIMDKRSTHWADVLIWLEKVANSCQTKEQAKNCERLVWNFHRKYQNEIGLAACFDNTREIDRRLLDLTLPSFNIKQKL